MEDVSEILKRNADNAARIRLKNAQRNGVVAISALGARGVHGAGDDDVDWIVCLLRTSNK